LALMQLLFLSGLANIVRDPVSQRHLPQTLNADDIAFSQALLLVFVLLMGLIACLGVLRARTTSRH